MTRLSKLREIKGVKQYENERPRRWFQNARFDLYIWEDAAGGIFHFQLAYGKPANERLIQWHWRSGYEHHQLAPSRHSLGYPETPLLMQNPSENSLNPEISALAQEFRSDAADMEPRIREFVLEHLTAYQNSLELQYPSPEIGGLNAGSYWSLTAIILGIIVIGSVLLFFLSN
ncbi:MAG: hypothetical protein AAF387_20565, partial [Pseudomonadota bacterium]